MKNDKSEFFLLPLTRIPKKDFKSSIGIFSLNSHYPELTHHVFVLFDNSAPKSELMVLTRKKSFVDYEQIGDYTLLTFDIKEFESEHTLFLSGKYSQFSDKAKNCIEQHTPFKLKNSKGVIEDTSIFKILYPIKQERETLEKLLDVKLEENAEIYSKPDIIEETFNIDNI